MKMRKFVLIASLWEIKLESTKEAWNWQLNLVSHVWFKISSASVMGFLLLDPHPETLVKILGQKLDTWGTHMFSEGREVKGLSLLHIYDLSFLITNNAYLTSKS